MLVECRECRREVSDQAPVCPYCGIEHPAPPIRELKKSVLRRVVGVLILVIVVLILVPRSDDEAKPEVAAKAKIDKPIPRMTEEEKRADAAAWDAMRAEPLERARASRTERLEREAQGRRTEARCRQTFSCYFRKHELHARSACIRLTQQSATYAYEWIDGWAERKFTKQGWGDRQKGTLRLSGNNIRMQNEYGAWKRTNYTCEFDPATRMTKVSFS